MIAGCEHCQLKLIGPKEKLQFFPAKKEVVPLEKDFLLSYEELKKRADSGDSSAQLLVGLALRNGGRNLANDEELGNKYILMAAKIEKLQLYVRKDIAMSWQFQALVL